MGDDISVLFEIFLGLQDDDGDYMAKLAKLVNGMGLQLISCWQK